MREFKFDIDDWTGGNTIGKSMGDVIGSTVGEAFKLVTYPTKEFTCLILQGYPNMKIDWGDGEVTYTANLSLNNVYNPLKHVYKDGDVEERVATVSFTDKNINTDVFKQPLFFFVNKTSVLKEYMLVNGYKGVVYNFVSTQDTYYSIIKTNEEYGCKITISPNINTIEEDALYGFITSQEFIIPDTVKHIAKRAFYNMIIRDRLVLPKYAKIDSDAFSSMRRVPGTNGVDLIIPDTITVLPHKAFFFTNLEGKLVLPKNLKVIDKHCFNGSTFYGRLELPESLEKIDDGAFYNVHFIEQKNLTIPNSVIEIGDDAFGHYNISGTLTLGKNLEVIGNRAFRGCNGIKGSVTIPKSVKEVKNHVFANCDNIEKIYIYEKTKIGDNATPIDCEVIIYK